MFTRSLFFILILFSFSAHAQDYDTAQRRLHRSFHDSFNTTDYLCTVSNVSEITYDVKSKKWSIDNSSKYHLGKKELIRIIKSDDINSPIPLCNPRDEPQTYSSKDNKYFCLINTHPKSDSVADRLFSKPDEIDSTHYKCLLDIKQNYGKENVHTLVCNGNFKFVLNFAKYFSSDLSIGPYRDFPQEKLSQRFESADCTKINN